MYSYLIINDFELFQWILNFNFARVWLRRISLCNQFMHLIIERCKWNILRMGRIFEIYFQIKRYLMNIYRCESALYQD